MSAGADINPYDIIHAATAYVIVRNHRRQLGYYVPLRYWIFGVDVNARLP